MAGKGLQLSKERLHWSDFVAHPTTHDNEEYGGVQPPPGLASSRPYLQALYAVRILSQAFFNSITGVYAQLLYRLYQCSLTET